MNIGRKSFSWVVGLMVSGVLVSGHAFSADTYEYPELMVTPRASDRIEAEAKLEKDRRFTNHLALQASALSTLLAGVFQISDVDAAKDPEKRSPYAGLAVGGIWLAVTTAMAVYDTPYSDVAHDLEGMPRKSVREQLTRERMAEEALRRRARIGMTMKWLSAATNFGAAAYMFGNASSGSFGKVADGIAMALAFSPVVFRYHWQDVAEEQADYKKRIYAPVASAGLLRVASDGKFVPGLQLSLHF